MHAGWLRLWLKAGRLRSLLCAPLGTCVLFWGTFAECTFKAPVSFSIVSFSQFPMYTMNCVGAEQYMLMLSWDWNFIHA